jgi:hypothetical protein
VARHFKKPEQHLLCIPEKTKSMPKRRAARAEALPLFHANALASDLKASRIICLIESHRTPPQDNA